MNIKSRGKKLVNSFKYAFNGFKLTFKNEQNMVIHIIVATIVTICGFIFKIQEVSGNVIRKVEIDGKLDIIIKITKFIKFSNSIF